MSPDFDNEIDAELDAFINGQLDAERRFAVVQYLAHNPARAAKVMQGLQLTEGLRLVFGGGGLPAAPQLDLAADRLARALWARNLQRRLLPLVAAAAMFAFGWGAHSVMGNSGLVTRGGPDRQVIAAADLLDAALDAQEAVALRLSLAKDIGPMSKNAAEISDRLGITLPEFPNDWVIRGAQVVATPERPGIALVIDTPDLGQIMLFSVLRTYDGPDGDVIMASQNGRGLAYFENDKTAFVLVDEAGPMNALRLGAEKLRHRFH